VPVTDGDRQQSGLQQSKREPARRPAEDPPVRGLWQDPGPLPVRRLTLARVVATLARARNKGRRCHSRGRFRTYQGVRGKAPPRVARTARTVNHAEDNLVDKILLTPVEAAAALGIGRSKVYELLQSGQLPSVHIGRCRRVPADAVHSFASSLRRSRPMRTQSGRAGVPA
jgi:excisionase family DNA binding protein